MQNVQQDILCALLEILREEGLISREMYDKSGETVRNTRDWPDWLCLAGEEAAGGGA